MATFHRTKEGLWMRFQGDGSDHSRLNRNILVRSLLPAGSTLEEGSIRLHDEYHLLSTVKVLPSSESATARFQLLS